VTSRPTVKPTAQEVHDASIWFFKQDLDELDDGPPVVTTIDKQLFQPLDSTEPSPQKLTFDVGSKTDSAAHPWVLNRVFKTVLYIEVSCINASYVPVKVPRLDAPAARTTSNTSVD
jgi:hypothetical protein